MTLARSSSWSVPVREPTDPLSQGLAEAVALPARSPGGPAPIPAPLLGRRTARHDGFSLHAEVAVASHDRQGLERLCRYGLRPPLSLSRLTRAEDGRLTYRMKRTFSDGTRELRLTPLELLRRLCVLIPPPRVHVTRYHGIFAPNARHRRAVTGQGRGRRSRRPAVPPVVVAPPATGVPPDPATAEGVPPAVPASAPPSANDRPASAQLGAPPDSPLRPRTLPWAELLRRVHELDALRCNRCPGRRRVIAFITDPEVVTAILAHLGLPTQPPSLAPARAPPMDA
jgi:hypothetical protein